MSSILAIDQGTTSTRALVFTPAGEVIASSQQELALSYPQKGWVEQDPEAIWQDTLNVCKNVLSQLDEANWPAAIGITNQRETTVIWDRETGQCVYPAIVWQDRRTAEYCQQLKTRISSTALADKTGLLLDPYFSASKIAWILNQSEDIRRRAEAGELAFGTIDSFLLWRLTGGKQHATDITNASRTLLFDIQRGCWDKELLALFDIPAAILPEVKENVADFGTTDSALFGRPIAIGGMAGDQQSALIGQACFSPGMVKSTYGTGCFVLMNIGAEFKASSQNLLTTPAYKIHGQLHYAIEGSIFVAGAAIQWLRDQLCAFEHAADSEKLARSVEDSNDVFFVPAFVGLGAPHWDPNARAAITGLTRESNIAHITRAALEAQGFQTADLMSAIIKDAGHNPAIIRADGGLVANTLVCQFIADIINRPLQIPACSETTALGAAYLAGLQVGIYQSLEDVASQWQKSREYLPAIGQKKRASMLADWQQAVASVRRDDTGG